MIRTAGVLAGALFVLTPFLMGQELQSQAQPSFPEDKIAPRQLVVWTWMLKPQPMPQPLPPSDKSISPAGQDPVANPQASAISDAFIGMIVKDGNRQLVLKTVNGVTYRLSDQDGVKQYEDKDVRVSGTLNPADSTIRITNVESLS